MRVPNIGKVLKAISDLNHIYNEQVTLHRLTKTVCTACGFDPITKQAVNSLCDVCGGTGYTTVDSPITVPASVEQNSAFQHEILLTGLVLDGKVWVVLDAKELTDHAIDVKTVDHFTWQGDKYKLVQSLPQYLQGTLYEMQVELERQV